MPSSDKRAKANRHENECDGIGTMNITFIFKHTATVSVLTTSKAVKTWQ